MSAAFETWTVLAHRPIEKLEENLWRVEGHLPNGRTQRSMIVARMRDGRLLIHNAIALDEHEMAELEAFREPVILVVPNGFHRQDARIWKQRYPSMRVYCPRGGIKAVAKVVSVDGDLDSMPSDDSVRMAHLVSMKGGEGYLVIRSEARSTLVLNDALLNLPKAGGVMGFLLAPTGRPSVPRVMRWMQMRSRADCTRELSELAALPELGRICVGHGKTLEGDVKSILHDVAATL